ncbi:hypothetical protein NB689_001343 [Xanthomonas sacchari]|nr:hypothetical protein [Xanthomonas sacchari]
MPSYSDTPAPSANTNRATMKLQKYSSRPWPNGWVASAGRAARRSPYSSNSSLTVSTSECTPSLSIAELPESPAATNLAMAMARLPASAA